MRPPGYGRARAVHEWKVAGRWIPTSAVALALLRAAVRYVGGHGDTGSLRAGQSRVLWVAGLDLVIAASCTLFPERAPEGVAPGKSLDTGAGTGRRSRR